MKKPIKLAFSAQALESDHAAVASIQEKIAQGRSLIAERQAQVQEARTAPQQLVDAQAKWQSSVGEVERAKADVRTYAPVSGVIGPKTVGSARGFSRDKVYLPSFPSTISGSPQISRKPSLSTCARVNP
jgi:hypothetical protein